MIKIYGSPLSTAGRTMWMAEETGQAWEQVSVDMGNREHKGEAFLKLNPNGKVPVAVDGEYVIWESMAINSYFADKYKPEMLGSTPEDRGHVMQWTFWAVANLAHPVEVLAVQKFRSTPDDQKTAEARETIARFLPVFEQSIVGKNYLVADRFTVADLNLASVVGTLNWVGFDMSSYPNIQRWFATIAQRPAFQKIYAQRAA